MGRLLPWWYSHSSNGSIVNCIWLHSAKRPMKPPHAPNDTHQKRLTWLSHADVPPHPQQITVAVGLVGVIGLQAGGTARAGALGAAQLLDRLVERLGGGELREALEAEAGRHARALGTHRVEVALAASHLAHAGVVHAHSGHQVHAPAHLGVSRHLGREGAHHVVGEGGCGAASLVDGACGHKVHGL